ncbi:MAG: diacylglycerol/lipid kinase family protein [Armatimonadota bacterium]
MPRVCFIVNPTAGGGRALRAWKRIEPLAASLGGYGVRLTEKSGHAKVLARRAAEDGYDRVAALGGDGTLNEVCNGVIGTGAAVGVVPAGTGNGWVRTTGIPLNPAAAVRTVYEGRCVKTDVGYAVGHRHFLNIAGIGFDAEVARWVNSRPALKSVGGTVPWLLGIVEALRRFRGVRVTAELDGKRVEVERMVLMAVGIACYYGDGLKILPDARIDDGWFDVAWGEDLGAVELMILAWKARTAGHVRHPKVSFARCARVTVSASSKTAFHLDGDVAGHLPVTFELLPSALDVVVP